MKALVVYDSEYGNTARIARAVGKALGPPDESHVVPLSDLQPERLLGLDLLVVGSPTQRFSPTPAISSWLKDLEAGTLDGVTAAAFDTRFTESKIGEIKILAFFVSIFGYAAKKIARRLERKGAQLLFPPAGFYVSDTDGPLLEGEMERAEQWAARIKEELTS